MIYLPQPDDERTTLCKYLEVQLDAVRAAAYGLDERQARETPFRSALSIAGIIKHCGQVMASSLHGAGLLDDPEGDELDHMASFALTGDETLESVLARFDRRRDAYLAMCREGDLDAELPIGPMPWYGLDEARPARLRYQYVHHVEEFARHAGHADLIREQLDGATAGELVLAVEGLPGNAILQPWSPDRAKGADAEPSRA